MKDELVEAAGIAVAKEIEGPAFDPFADPEAFEFACSIARAAIAAIQPHPAPVADKDAEIARLSKAIKLQMDEKHKEAAEAKLWFEKAQEWRQCLAALQAHADALAEAIRDGCEAMKVARNTIPDDDEGLAANIFAHHLNWADSTMASALRAYEAFKAGEGE